MREIAAHLRSEFPTYPIQTSEAKYCLVKFVSFFRSDAAKIMAYWGREKNFNNTRSREVLGINYKPASQSLTEMVNSMIELGILEDKRP